MNPAAICAIIVVLRVHVSTLSGRFWGIEWPVPASTAGRVLASFNPL
jgi:hypothetical protein